MLSEIHFLLTYQCNFECEHCFLYCSPWTEGTFTIQGVEEVLQEALKLGTIDTIYFEGGEPTLYYPLLVESIRRAAGKGFQVGIVTNAYGALTEEDAQIWLKPLVEAGLDILSVSEDAFHYGDEKNTPPSFARKAARKLKLESFPISIDPPEILENPDPDNKGQALIGGGAMFRGRAADTLTEGLPKRPWAEFRTCPYEDLVNPSRVHVDSFGNVQICQGISLGNFQTRPLSEIMGEYRVEEHPICGPLHRSGPAGLIEELGLRPEEHYVDECQACFFLRRQIIADYPDILCPRQVYGLD